MRKKIFNILTLFLAIVLIGLGILIGFNFTHLRSQIQSNNTFSPDTPPVYRYMVILDGTDGDFVADMRYGMDKASEDYSVAYELWSFKGEDKEESILRQLDIGIESKVDGILVQAFSDQRFEVLLVKAKRYEVPIITLTNDVPSQEKVSAVSYNKYQMGSRIGEVLRIMISESGKTRGTIAILQNSPLFDQSQAFAIQDSLEEGFVVRPISFTSDSDRILNAEELAMSIVRDYSDLVAFICLSAEETRGVVSAVKSANMMGDVAIIGSGDDRDIVDYLSRGVLEAIIVPDISNIGYHAIWDMTKYNDGHFVSQYRDIPVEIIVGENLEAYLQKAGEK